MRSRGLAIVEGVSLFVLAIALVFDARLCKSSFELNPEILTVDRTIYRTQAVQLNDTGADVWSLLQTTNESVAEENLVSFRVDDSHTMPLIATLFMLRFCFSSAANTQWQTVQYKWPRSLWSQLPALFAVVCSIWSLTMTVGDARYCRFPTSVGYDTTADNHG